MFEVKYFHVGFAVTVAVFVFLPEPSKSDCWETGCQLSNWATTGCQQYGRKEVSRRPCPGGNHYTCCAAGSGGGGGNGAGGGLSRQGDLTWYDLTVGLVACGQQYTNNDMVAALAFHHFTTPNPNNDPMCGRRIKIVDPSSQKEITVRVVDKCEGCRGDDVDVSPTAFQMLKPLGVGRFKIRWDFV